MVGDLAECSGLFRLQAWASRRVTTTAGVRHSQGSRSGDGSAGSVLRRRLHGAASAPGAEAQEKRVNPDAAVPSLSTLRHNDGAKTDCRPNGLARTFSASRDAADQELSTYASDHMAPPWYWGTVNHCEAVFEGSPSHRRNRSLSRSIVLEYQSLSLRMAVWKLNG